MRGNFRMTAHCIYLRMLRDFSEQFFYRAPYFMYKLQNIMASSRRLARCLQEVFKTSCMMPSRCLCKTSSGRLQDVLDNVKLLRWRRVEDVFKTCFEDAWVRLKDQQMCAGNPFGVDVPLTEKPGGLSAQAGTENCPRVNF